MTAAQDEAAILRKGIEGFRYVFAASMKQVAEEGLVSLRHATGLVDWVDGYFEIVLAQADAVKAEIAP